MADQVQQLQRRGGHIPAALALLAVLVSSPATSAQALAPTIDDDLAGCIAALHEPLEAATEALPLPLRIATWNSMKFKRRGSRAMLRRLAAYGHLVFLQESLRDAPDSAQRWRLFAPGYGTDDFLSGVELRSPVAADRGCTLRFREPWLQTPKAVLAARFALPGGRPLLVVSLHAINFTLGSESYRQQWEAIGRLLDAHRGPALIAGDFNHWNPWRRQVLERFARERGLSWLPLSPDWRSTHLGRPVDAVLLRGMIGIAGSALPTRSSDHHPIIGSLLRDRSPDAGADSGAAGTPQDPTH